MRAMILAAGRGERMRPATDRVPKPLLPVAGKPLIFWLIERLVANGYSEIVVNVSHLGAMIEEALGNGASLGAQIKYSREAQPLETAGGIAAALPLLGEAPFMVVNGDVYTDLDFSRLRPRKGTLDGARSLAHLVLVPNPGHHPGGDFTLEEGYIGRGQEHRLTFSGVGVYHPQLFAAIPPGSKYALARLLHEPILQRRVTGERHEGLWLDVGTPDRLAALERLLASSASRGP